MAHKEKSIFEKIEVVTDGTIDMIQTITDDSVKKQLISQYCGRLSTWEESWISAFKEKHDIPNVTDKHSERSYSADRGSDLAKTSLVSSPNSASSQSSDNNRKSVSAINKVLERYNLMRKRSVH